MSSTQSSGSESSATSNGPYIGLQEDGMTAEEAVALVREELSSDTPPIYNFARFGIFHQQRVTFLTVNTVSLPQKDRFQSLINY